MRPFRSVTHHPVRAVPFAFALVIAAVTVLLMLPVAHTGPSAVSWIDALFTATSAVTVTGLSTVDVDQTYTGFGEAVIMAGMQVGGLGIVTSAAFLGLVVSRRLDLRSRLSTQAELNVSLSLGDLRGLILKAFAIAGVVELAVTVVLSLRFYFGYGMDGGRALWQGLFHGVSAFNSGGYSLFGDSLVRHVADPWVIWPITVAAIVGSLGMPVLFELVRRHGRRPRHWSLHTKMTVTGTSLLFVGGFAVLLGFEWSNPATLGPFGWHEKLMPAFFQSVMLRTSGFNAIDVGAMHDHSLLVSIILMFIGGGSASTAGGIKVTTFVVLLWVIWSEVRGEPDASVFGTRLSTAVIRQALAVALVYVAVNAASVMLLQLFEPQFQLRDIMFEATSALATVGQSTGITSALSSPSKVLIIFLMFVGRIGPVLLATSLAMSSRQRLYRYPEGRPLVG